MNPPWRQSIILKTHAKIPTVLEINLRKCAEFIYSQATLPLNSTLDQAFLKMLMLTANDEEFEMPVVKVNTSPMMIICTIWPWGNIWRVHRRFEGLLKGVYFFCKVGLQRACM